MNFHISRPNFLLETPVICNRSNDCSSELNWAWNNLSFLEGDYPGFSQWFWQKVSAGLEQGDRRIFVSRKLNKIQGIVIAKRDGEKKICTVWTAQNQRGKGVASLLFDDAIDWLQTDRPLISVPCTRSFELLPLLEKYQFVKTQTLSGYYRPESSELVFNGFLTPQLSS